MGQIWVREFLGGLDARRMPETTSGGVLIEAVDGHITRGGDFETRASFVETYTLPPGTVGLAAVRSGIVVFGSDTDPGVPSGVTFQQLAHEGQELVDVPSYDLYSGKIYAVGVFADGSRQHFYDSDRVEDWFDGRARSSFRITGGVNSGAVQAIGSFDVTGGTLSGGNEITNVTVDSVAVVSAAIPHTGDNDTTADAIVSNINGHTSSPNYTAFANGATVNIVAESPGSAANDRVVAVTVGGDVTVANEQPMSGGADNATSTITIFVAGVNITSVPIDWDQSNEETAQAVADAINLAFTNPNYSAVPVGDTVVILAEDPGEGENGKPVTFTLTFGFSVTPSEDVVMAGGASAEDTFAPGTFVKTIREKMYSLSGPNMHFSGIGVPTGWTTDNVGAGFTDMSTFASGAEELQAVANYQQSIAVFGETNIQIWYVDPDPALNRIQQILSNTGTYAPHSVTQFGDDDLFYLDESGIRSLRARDASSAAATTDIGVPIDTLVQPIIQSLSDADMNRIFGLIEPRDKRFWLIVKDTIFVLSYFRGPQTVSAWTTYKLDFEVDNAVVYNKRVYLRSGDKIYVYGGLGPSVTYDDTTGVARLPFLDAENPVQKKYLTGLDVACEGEWKAYVHMNPRNIDAKDKIGTFYGSTFSDDKHPADGSSTHFGFTFKSQGVGPHKLSSFIAHYTADDSGKDDN